MSDSCDPMDCRSLGSIGFCKQRYWREWLFPSLGDLPDKGRTHVSSTAGRFFTAEPPRKLILIKGGKNAKK